MMMKGCLCRGNLIPRVFISNNLAVYIVENRHTIHLIREQEKSSNQIHLIREQEKSSNQTFV